MQTYDNRTACVKNEGGFIMYIKNAEKEQLRQGFNILKAALYIRLSREDGDKSESDSVVSQKEILKEFLKLHPELELYDFYVDDGYTGTNFERPGFERMINDISSGKVKCVIVKDLSRFARNYTDSGYYIENFFVRHGVRFIAVNNGVDSASGNMNAATQCIAVGVTNVINESVAATTSVNVKGTLNVRRQNGKFIGSFPAYGYLKDPLDRHKLVIDEEAAGTVRMIFEKYISGISILGITRELNEMGIPNPSAYKKQKGFNYGHPASKINDGMWSESSVRRILRNEMYIGNMVQGKSKKISYKIKQCVSVPREEWIIVEGTHEPIVSKETFEKAQSFFNRNIRKSPQKKEVDLFAGLVKCADCGRAMSKKSNKHSYGEYHYYRCTTARKMNKGSCTNHTIRIDKIEEAVLVFLQKMVEVATEYDEIIKAVNACPERKSKSDYLQKAVEKNLRERDFLSNMVLELYPDWKRGNISKEEYIKLKDECNRKLLKIDEEIKELKEKIKEIENGFEENAFVTGFRKIGNIDRLTRPVVTEFVDKILVHEGGRITICLKCKDEFEQAFEYVEMNKDAVKTA